MPSEVINRLALFPISQIFHLQPIMGIIPIKNQSKEVAYLMSLAYVSSWEPKALFQKANSI